MESRLAVADLQKAADNLVIALACAGDDSAFAEVLRRRQARVRKFMYHLCRQPALGDDLAQQVFLTAWRSIGRLRSAVAFDGRTSINEQTFYRLLERVMPIVAAASSAGRTTVPWDVLPWEPKVHLALFVHLVDGLTPGLYCLVRDAAKLSLLRRQMHGDFMWVQPFGCPQSLPLFCLAEGDGRRLAAQVSCHQDIAGASAFSLGMLAEFEEPLQTIGPWVYPRLYWECGVIGQVLYLEAEAAGVRATGIGCFFDDPVHEVFGLKDRTFQSLYHFTVGGAVEDHRLTTLPPYGERPPKGSS